MSESQKNFDLEAAETAYAVISRYVEHTQIAGVIIALLASKLGEENLGFLVETDHWKNYMNSRRDLESAQADIQTLTEIINNSKS